MATQKTTKIALLRGINVSGKNIIKMADLREILESGGLKNVRTYIQSGNIVFESGLKFNNLEKRISNAIKDTYSFDVPVMVRDRLFFENMVAANPFKKNDPKQIAAAILSKAPTASSVKALNELKLKFSPDEFHIAKDIVYLCCPNGFGRTKLTNTFLEKKLGVSATTRNWRTIARLIEMSI